MSKRLMILLMMITVLPVFIFAGTTGKIAGVVQDKDTGEPLGCLQGLFAFRRQQCIGARPLCEAARPRLRHEPARAFSAGMQGASERPLRRRLRSGSALRCTRTEADRATARRTAAPSLWAARPSRSRSAARRGPVSS